MASGICSACFLRKRRRYGEYPLSLLSAFAASSPKGTPLGCAGRFAAAEAFPRRMRGSTCH